MGVCDMMFQNETPNTTKKPHLYQIDIITYQHYVDNLWATKERTITMYKLGVRTVVLHNLATSYDSFKHNCEWYNESEELYNDPLYSAFTLENWIETHKYILLDKGLNHDLDYDEYVTILTRYWNDRNNHQTIPVHKCL